MHRVGLPGNRIEWVGLVRGLVIGSALMCLGAEGWAVDFKGHEVGKKFAKGSGLTCSKTLSSQGDYFAGLHCEGDTRIAGFPAKLTVRTDYDEVVIDIAVRTEIAHALEIELSIDDVYGPQGFEKTEIRKPGAGIDSKIWTRDGEHIELVRYLGSSASNDRGNVTVRFTRDPLQQPRAPRKAL